LAAGTRAFSSSAWNSTDTATLVSRMFGTIDCARAVGNAYLSVRPNEESRSLLERTLLWPKNDTSRYQDQRQLFTTLMTRVRTDFEFGRVVIVDGWMLSETEARLCALVALSCP
jgi:hypothetical protein